MADRLQKILARAGIASRRAAEDIVLAGRVRVNGRVVTELGAKADPRDDRIEVDGRRLKAEEPVYLMLHKPRGVVSTLRDPEGRPTVADLLRDVRARVYPVGRLDYATSGVLLFTNDGDFANGLLHPRRAVPKTYVLKVKGVMSDEDLEPWRKGVELEDGRTLPAEARLLRHGSRLAAAFDGRGAPRWGASRGRDEAARDRTMSRRREADEAVTSWIEITLREGRNQQIRRMGEATGWPVMRLSRTSFAGIGSEGLLPGQWRHLTLDELLALRKEYGVPKRVRSATRRAPGEAGAHGDLVPRGGQVVPLPKWRRDRAAARTPEPQPGRGRGEGGKPPAPPARPARGARPERPARPDGPRASGPSVRSGRTGRSGRKPRGAG